METSYKEVIGKLIEELTLPAGQGWVSLDELKDKAVELDGNKERHNDRLEH